MLSCSQVKSAATAEFETATLSEAAQGALRQHDYRQTVTLIDQALALGVRAARPSLHKQRLFAIDRGGLGDVETREKEALLATSSPSDAIDLRLALGRIALRRGDFATALRLGSTMKSLLAPNDKARRAQALRLEATAKWSQGSAHDSIALHGAAAGLCREAGDLVGEALAVNDRGLVRGYIGDFVSALGDHEAAQAILARAPDSEARTEATAQVANDLGFALWNVARHAEALASLTTALTLRTALHDVYGQGITHNNLGNVHRSCGRIDQARVAYDAALRLCRDSGNALYEAIALNNLGQLAIDAGDVAWAEARLKEALALTQRIGDRIREADNLGNLGSVYLRAKDYPRAVESLSRAVDMRRQLRDLAYLVSDLSALAVALAEVGDELTARDALAEVETAIDAGQQGIEQVQTVHLHVFEAYTRLRNPEPAMAALRRAVASVHQQADALEDPAMRHAFLNNLAVNRAILGLAEQHGLSR